MNCVHSSEDRARAHWVEGRLAGPGAGPRPPPVRVTVPGPGAAPDSESDSDSGSERRCPAGAAGAAESLATGRRSLRACDQPPSQPVSLGGPGTAARPARGSGRAAGRLQPRRSHDSISAAAAGRSDSFKYADLETPCYVKSVSASSAVKGSRCHDGVIGSRLTASKLRVQF